MYVIGVLVLMASLVVTHWTEHHEITRHVEQRLIDTNSVETTMTHELIKGDTETLLLKLRAVLDDGNVRRVLVKHDGRTVAAFPLLRGVVGTAVARTLAAIGIIAVLKDCSLEIEKDTEASGDLPEAKAS
jgi:hypothetical protein